VIGFAATIFCYLGVNLFLSGLHSYGSAPKM
jgi:ABC-type transport system involved in cytochrome c biogenesis permease subunit